MLAVVGGGGGGNDGGNIEDEGGKGGGREGGSGIPVMFSDTSNWWWRKVSSSTSSLFLSGVVRESNKDDTRSLLLDFSTFNCWKWSFWFMFHEKNMLKIRPWNIHSNFLSWLLMINTVKIFSDEIYRKHDYPWVPHLTVMQRLESYSRSCKTILIKLLNDFRESFHIHSKWYCYL